MAATIESTGEIEILCQSDDLSTGKTARIVFRTWDDASPPFKMKVRAPNGQIILDRLIRELPTGKPQSAPPVTFSIIAPGEYKIEIGELYGKKAGEATLRVP